MRVKSVASYHYRFTGLKYLDKPVPLLKQLHDVACEQATDSFTLTNTAF